MNKPHRWAEVIKAWADGAEVECRDMFFEDSFWGPWSEDDQPINWNDPHYIFRVKVEPVVEVRYFKLTDFQGHTCYMEFTPDLEKWDMKITYVDGFPNEVLLT
jgi:hypothetical protein